MKMAYLHHRHLVKQRRTVRRTRRGMTEVIDDGRELFVQLRVRSLRRLYRRITAMEQAREDDRPVLAPVPDAAEELREKIRAMALTYA